MAHIPVLLNEVIQYLNLKDGDKLIDGTLGSGGYEREIVKLNPKIRILGIDLDRAALDKLKREFAKSGLDQNVRLVGGNYADLKQIAYENSFDQANAVLLDLGFSSMQLDDHNRGFSFQAKTPLDMRYDQSQKLSAADVVNNYPETKLLQILKEYGEEHFSRRIVTAILRQRKISAIASTDQVLDLIKTALPKPVRHKANDSARRVFQAIRIEVNNELGNLQTILPQMLEVLKPKGRILIISFHSLEDRIVKQFFVREDRGCICPPDFPTCVCGKAANLRILTRKPVTATEDEKLNNPRSHSAKLRVAEKI